MRAAAIVAMLTVAAGCNNKLNQAVFGVASDLPVAMLDGITVVVSSDAGVSKQKTFTLTQDASSSLPAALVAYTLADRLPAVDVTVIGTRAGAEVLRRRAHTTLLPEQTRFVRLALEARCVGVTCAADQTCVEGACASIEVDLSRALPYVSGEEYAVACGDPMFRYSADDSPIPPPDGGCEPAQPCVEGTCYQPPGAAPIGGAGNLAIGGLGDFQID